MKAKTMMSSTVPLSRPYTKNSVKQQPKNPKVYNHLFTATNINSVLPLRSFDEKLYLQKTPVLVRPTCLRLFTTSFNVNLTYF